ncbi:hypothetical protein JCM18899A_39330 [Nocardioides sp. AN3]
MGNAGQAQSGRDRARDARLKAARERRLQLDPDQIARERRIDEVAAAAAIERLVAEKLAVKDIVQLTGLDQATVRRLRQLGTEEEAAQTATVGDASGSTDAAGVRVA